MHTDEHRIYRSAHDSARRPPRIARRPAPANEAFYIDLLGGREVWPTERKNRRGSRWFLVEETLIELRSAAFGGNDSVELAVDSPEDLAERAWDAGYSVEVHEDDAGVTLTLVDPTGRRIRLLQRPRVEPLSR
jgi:catechol 2,3-dioxygenase-like lactoylglutathione lyase family enzyme